MIQPTLGNFRMLLLWRTPDSRSTAKNALAWKRFEVFAHPGLCRRSTADSALMCCQQVISDPP